MPIVLADPGRGLLTRSRQVSTSQEQYVPSTPPNTGTKPLVLFSSTFAVYNTDLPPQVNLGTNDLLLLDANKAFKCLRTYLVFAIGKSLSRCASRRFTAQTNVFLHKVSKMNVKTFQTFPGDHGQAKGLVKPS